MENECTADQLHHPSKGKRQGPDYSKRDRRYKYAEAYCRVLHPPSRSVGITLLKASRVFRAKWKSTATLSSSGWDSFDSLSVTIHICIQVDHKCGEGGSIMGGFSVALAENTIQLYVLSNKSRLDINLI